MGKLKEEVGRETERASKRRSSERGEEEAGGSVQEDQTV